MGSVEIVVRSLAKRMESHKLICESFSHIYLYAYITGVVSLFCDVSPTLHMVSLDQWCLAFCNINILWDVTPCILVEIYGYF